MTDSEAEDLGVLRGDAEHKFKHENHPQIELFYRFLISDQGYKKPSDAPKPVIKSVELYLHILGLRRAKPEDLRRWKALNIIDDKEEFKDDYSEIHANDEGEISKEEYHRLIMNITLHSLAWSGFVNIDPDDHSVIYTGKEVKQEDFP